MLMRLIDHHRPDFGIDQKPCSGLKMPQKPGHHLRRVPRLPHLHIAVVQQIHALLSARGRAVREHKLDARMRLANRGHQCLDGAGFTQRHRVDPHTTCAGGHTVVTETL